MRILAIIHQADAGPGVFGEAVSAAGHQLEIWEPAEGEPPPEPETYGAVLTFGGGMHPDQEGAHPWLAAEKSLLGRALERELPVLAVCLGAELLAEAAGGFVRRASGPEIGWYSVTTDQAARQDPLFAALPVCFQALEWHSYEFLLRPGAIALAASETCLQAYRAGPRAWGIQFHAEVTLETFESWLDTYREDLDAVRLGIDPERLRDQTRGAIEEWNRIGYDLCTRFLYLAGGVPEGGAG
ncbi:MAG: type 1 glutamine amidotransferase [Candidatus Woesearchaeota archaeon]